MAPGSDYWVHNPATDTNLSLQQTKIITIIAPLVGPGSFVSEGDQRAKVITSMMVQGAVTAVDITDVYDCLLGGDG